MLEVLDQILGYTRSLPVDVVNGSFEIVGALICSTNISRIRKDRAVEGFNPATQLFFAVWGLWNLIYYPALGQTWSFWGGVALVAVNITWLLHVWYYSRQRKKSYKIRKKYKGLNHNHIKERYPSSDQIPTVEVSPTDKFLILGRDVPPEKKENDKFIP